MTTRTDIQQDEPITITVRVDEIDEWTNHEHIARKVICSDTDGDRVPLTIFHNNDAAEFEWVVGRWYKLKNAKGNVFRGEKQLNPSNNLGIVSLDSPPIEFSNRGPARESTGTEVTREASKADGGALTHSKLTPGNYLLDFPLGELSELEVLEYQLNIPGGFEPDDENDVMAFTSRAAARYRFRSGAPVTTNGPMKLYALVELNDDLPMDDFTIEPEYLGRTTLEASDRHGRRKLVDIVKQDLKAALDGKFDVAAINSIIEFSPSLRANSGDFTAYRKYALRVWIDPDGTAICGVAIKFHLQSTFSAAEYLEWGYDIDNVNVEHDTEVYSRPATGRIVELSETKYTEPVAEMGNTSIADYHRDRGYVDPDLIDAIAAGDPQLAKIKYGRDSTGLQVLDFLRVVPTLEQLKLVDEPFHERFQRTARMLPEERFAIATSFVKSIERLPSLGLDFQPIPTNECYDELCIDTRFPNLRFGDDKTARYGAAGLREHGVYQAPESFDVLGLYPHVNEQESQDFIRELLKLLDEYDAAPTQVDQETYRLGAEFAYTQVASDATNYDSVLGIVPDPTRLPADVADPYPEFKRQFAQAKVPSQMVTRDNLREQGYYGNIAAGLIAGCGGVPWRVDEVPGGTDVFVGLDVTYDHSTGQHLGASANIVYADGTILASQTQVLQAGETFEIDDIVNVIKNLLRVYVEEENRTPQNIVIHRDGRFYCDVDELVSRFEGASGLDTELDLVEILKSGTPRIAEFTGKSFEVANKGVGFVSRNDDHAYLATTGKPELKPGNSVGTPRPIRIVKRHGTTDLETLIEQVYWLSEAHVGSISRSTRLPITTYYADRCADHARKGYLLSGELISGVPYV